jgi:hypothetical protein
MFAMAEVSNTAANTPIRATVAKKKTTVRTPQQQLEMWEFLAAVFAANEMDITVLLRPTLSERRAAEMRDEGRSESERPSSG